MKTLTKIRAAVRGDASPVTEADLAAASEVRERLALDAADARAAGVARQREILTAEETEAKARGRVDTLASGGATLREMRAAEAEADQAAHDVELLVRSSSGIRRKARTAAIAAEQAANVENTLRRSRYADELTPLLDELVGVAAKVEALQAEHGPAATGPTWTSQPPGAVVKLRELVAAIHDWNTEDAPRIHEQAARQAGRTR